LRLFGLGFLSLVLSASGLAQSTLARSGEPQNARPAAGRVKSGTGFFVSPDGFVMTSAHVVAGCSKMSVWAADGVERSGYIIASDRARDIALLWADGTRQGASAMITGFPSPTGEEVFTLGYGVNTKEPLSPVVVEGSLVGGSMAQPGNRIVVIRAKLHPGNSGGALLAGDGSLLGMIVGRDEEHPEFGVAVPKEDLETLLFAYGITLPLRQPASNARDLLGAISVLIQCSTPRNSSAQKSHAE
jgi:S1-C subfamily serine protease